MKRKKTRLFINFLCMGITAILLTIMTSCVPTTTSKSSLTTTTKPTPTLSSITIAPSQPASLAIGFTLQFTATGTYTDGSTADITANVKWASSDNSIATINSAGVVTGVAVGTTNITATFGNVTNPAVTLTIVPTPALSSIAVTPTNPGNLGIGSTQLFAASGTYADGTTVDITSKVNWVSSDAKIATISSAGVATGVAVGSADITAALSGVTSQVINLTVVAFTLSSIQITPAVPANLAIGLTQQFTATALNSDGSTTDITSEVTWVSSDPGIATISSKGLATGISEGSTDITATFSGLTSDKAALPVSVLSSISVSPAAPDDLAVGSVQRFVAAGTFANGVVSMISAPVTWNSSDNNVATISTDGLATAIAAGKADITVSVLGLNSPAVTLTVIAAAATTATP